MRRTSYYIIIIVALIIISSPYILAGFSSDGNSVFGGFLFNPIDGNSYLAKMRQGFNGAWKFHLPYSMEGGEGAYIFTYYLLLGHVSRLINIPLILVFHIARIINSLFLLLAMARLIENIYTDQKPTMRIFSFVLVVFGSGLGWIIALFGGFTSDFWVAEMYPFLSMYANPHFPLGLAILLAYFSFVLEKNSKNKRLIFLVLGTAEASVFQFGVVIALTVMGVYQLSYWFRNNKINFQPLIYFGIGSLPIVVYQYYAILTDPILSQWNQQNLTQTPPFWDLLIALSPAIILVIGYFIITRKKLLTSHNLLVVWLISILILAYLPFNLQRRLLAGIFIPVGLLAVNGLYDFCNKKMRAFTFYASILIVFSFISNLLILLGGVTAAQKRDVQLFIRQSDRNAWLWIDNSTTNNEIMLTSPKNGLLVPVYTNLRVVYGHPFETVQSEKRITEVERIYSGFLSSEQIDNYLLENGIDYIYYGFDEQTYSIGNPFSELPIVYNKDGVIIYSSNDQ